MISNPHISFAGKKDIPALVLLVNNAYRNVNEDQGWTTEADLFKGSRANEESLQHLFNEPHSVFLEYRRDDDIVGCVYLQKQDQKMYLGVLGVSPALQDKGIGKDLLLAAEEYARHHKCKAITMTVISIRRELIEWYKRRGYREIGDVRPFPDDKVNRPNQPLQLLVLEKKIK